MKNESKSKKMAFTLPIGIGCLSTMIAICMGTCSHAYTTAHTIFPFIERLSTVGTENLVEIDKAYCVHCVQMKRKRLMFTYFAMVFMNAVSIADESGIFFYGKHFLYI